MTNDRTPSVIVVGSLHYDIVVDAPDRPRKGETVAGFSWRPKFGGKGGNQAVAAAKAGARVRMAGAVGNDDFGRFLLTALAEGGVDASCVKIVDYVGSGMSVAISDTGGDYGAVIVSGANLHTDPTSIGGVDLWQNTDVLILQNEIPEKLNIIAATAARTVGATVCVNAAPYRPMSDEFLGLVDVLIVNAVEAEQFGSAPVTNLATAEAAATGLSGRFPTVVVTAGSDGVVGVKASESAVVLKAIPVELVSTHGAGDVFVGAFVASIGAGQTFRDSLESANLAAAAHVSKQLI
jgi:ribokinase